MKWAGNEAAATGVSAAMVAVGVATVIPGAIAVRKHAHPPTIANLGCFPHFVAV